MGRSAEWLSPKFVSSRGQSNALPNKWRPGPVAAYNAAFVGHCLPDLYPCEGLVKYSLGILGLLLLVGCRNDEPEVKSPPPVVLSASQTIPAANKTFSEWLKTHGEKNVIV